MANTRTYPGELEIDAQRGVIYFHCSDPETARKFGSLTLLRVCQLPTPIPEAAIDLTHMHGVSYNEP